MTRGENKATGGDIALMEREARLRSILETAPDAILTSVRAAIATRSVAGADAEIAARIADLTPRERDVMRELVAGHPNKIIAHRLDISPRTVELHRARVMEKMQAASLPSPPSSA